MIDRIYWVNVEYLIDLGGLHSWSTRCKKVALLLNPTYAPVLILHRVRGPRKLGVIALGKMWAGVENHTCTQQQWQSHEFQDVLLSSFLVSTSDASWFIILCLFL